MPVACIWSSRCQARVSSSREIAMVAIFFPRFFAMTALLAANSGTVWRSAPLGSSPTAQPRRALLEDVPVPDLQV